MLPGLISMEESELSPHIGPHRRQRARGQRVCGCVHVRTGTIMLGMWHLVMNVLALSALVMVIFHPEMLHQVQLERAPTANLSAEGAGSEAVLPPRVMPKYGPTYSVLGGQVWNVDDLNIGIMIAFCTFIITLLMVVGAIKGQPSYLMPFFCLQVFDFFISSMTMISYFSMPDLHVMLVNSSSLPFRDQLLRLDQRWLSLFLMVTFLVVIVIKAYLIAMVMACSRYLLMRQAGGGGGGTPTEPDQAAALPDYEVALSDPRFSKVDLANYPAPPPSYDAATSEAGARAK